MIDRVRRSKGQRSPASSARDLAGLQRSLEERGVKFCLASYAAVHGIPKAKAVPIDHFERMMRGSELFTGAAIDAFAADPSSREVFGADPHASFIDIKQREWWSFHNAISKWELDNYLTKF